MERAERPDTLAPYVLAALDQRHARFSLREPFRIRRLSTPDLIRLAFRFGHELDVRGIGKGERILLWGQASPEWVAVFLGALLRGVVVVPLDDAAGSEFAGDVAKRTGPRLVAVARGSLNAAQAAFDEGLPLLVLQDLPQALANRPGRAPPPIESCPQDPVEILFTSGTTSEPKGVVLSHRNLLQNLQALEPHSRRWERRLFWLKSRPVVSALPLSHAFGQIAGMFAPLLMGLSPVFVSPPGPIELREALHAENAWVAIAVPGVLAALRRGLEAEERRAGRLERHLARRDRFQAAPWPWRRFVHRRIVGKLGRRFLGFVVGGAALDPAEERAWKSMGVLVVQGYGLTETAPVVAVSTPFAAGSGSVGRILGDQEVELAPDGEVLVRGANVAEGYFRQGGLTSLTDEDGWFHTGDLGAWDERGRLVIRGRSKDVIVTAGGLNVHPRDVELALGEQAGVREAAVIGRPSPDGERVHAVLLLEPRLLAEGEREREAIAAAAVRAANQALAGYQRVRSHSVWPHADFPRTPATQKVLKRALLAALEQGEAPRGSVVYEALRISLRASEELSDERTLAELDLSSLDVIELLAHLEAESEVELDATRVGADTSIGDLRRLLAGSESDAPTARTYPMPRWAHGTLGRLAGGLVRSLLSDPVTWAFCRLRVVGRDRPAALEGPALFVCNHSSYLDAPIAFRAVPRSARRRLSAAMATEPFHPLFTNEGGAVERARQRLRYTLAVLAFGAFPLPRAGGFRASLSYAAELVDRGRHVLVFPEGRMSEDGRLQPFRGGAALLATRLGIPVLPFRIEGLHAVLPPAASWPRRGPVRVVFGEPLRFDEATDPDEVTARLERAVRDA
jgi:long-chain acyl-CoA synthetase